MSDTVKFDLINIGSGFEALERELEARGTEPELDIKSLPKLNEILCGLRKKKLMVIGARTSQGKSSLAVQLAIDVTLQNKSVVFLSLEMETIECCERILAYKYEINNRVLLRGPGDKYKKQNEALTEEFSSKKFIFSDCIGRTWEEVDKLVEAWAKRGTVPDVIILDYIQNIKTGRNPKENYDEYIRHFREMAIRHNFAGILCSQINRTSPEAKDKTPQLHQLKGTGFLEEHADIVLLLHWPHFYGDGEDKNHFELWVAKNKMGQTGLINLRYFPQHYMFRDLQNNAVKEEVKWQSPNT